MKRVICALAAVSLLTIIAVAQKTANDDPAAMRAAAPPQSSTELAPGGDFSLTDHNGKRFRLSDYRGKVILLFFGYTSCTEACPVILGRINSVFKQLGSDRDKALAVFISVDPQRDTTAVLRDYVQYFSAHTIALTGKKEEIDAVVKQYGAMYEIEKSDSALGYHISHTTDIYLVDRQGALKSRFKHTDRAALITASVQHLLR
jgi:cytochrome oxidase Cu insertion factor (SCO1/SenC/PrrC family)